MISNINVSYNKMLGVETNDTIITNSYFKGSRIKTKRYEISNATINTWINLDISFLIEKKKWKFSMIEKRVEIL